MPQHRYKEVYLAQYQMLIPYKYVEDNIPSHLTTVEIEYKFGRWTTPVKENMEEEKSVLVCTHCSKNITTLPYQWSTEVIKSTVRETRYFEKYYRTECGQFFHFSCLKQKYFNCCKGHFSLEERYGTTKITYKLCEALLTPPEKLKFDIRYPVLCLY